MSPNGSKSTAYRILSPQETWELISKIWQTALAPSYEDGTDVDVSTSSKEQPPQNV
jgi:hypothetical protein